MIGSGLLTQNGKYLLVKAKVGAPKGLWNNPGGHKDEGETMAECARREVKEETGFDVVIKKLIGVYSGSVEKNVFEAEIVSGNLKLPVGEIADAKWFTIDEIKNLKNITLGARQSIFDYSVGKFNQRYQTEEIP